MCGIFGYIGNNFRKFDKELTTLLHRGPDYHASFTHRMNNHNIYLGHTRLSIIDLSAKANQPMTSSDQDIVLIFNGEIYNHVELRKKLLKNEVFNSTSDTETILRLYQKLGIDFINEINGDFAIAIYDKRISKIFLCRDRLGVKPLYYYKNENEFLFASEIKALLAAGVNKKISEQSLNSYFIFKYVPESNTLLSNVYRLKPGQYITFDLKSFDHTINTYWQLKKKSEYLKLRYMDAKVQLKELTSEVIKSQLMSDVPLGTFFSGGLDSSIIVYHLKDHKDIIHYAARKTIEDLKKEGSTSDYYYAEKFAREYSLNLIPIDIGNEELNIELIKKTIYYSDDLIADGSQIPSFLITLEASKRTKVLLSGMGADELFLGYAGHQLTLMASYFDNLPGFLKSILGSILGNLKAGQGLFKAYKRYLQKFGRYYNNPLRYGFYNIVGDLENSLSVYSSPNIDPLKLFKKYFQNDNDPFDNIFDFELNNFLIKNLHYIDRMCMANSVEGRIPFLDYRLVEFAYSLPRSYKLSQTGKSKRILKDMASAYLPEYIIKRRKAGFGMPLRSILSNEEKINSLIDFEMLNEIKNFSVDSIRRIIKNHINGTEDNSALIYSIISFQLWYKEFSSQ